MTQRRKIFLTCIGVMLFAGCVPRFQTVILNRSSADLVHVECEFPSGKRIAFHDVAPMRIKTFNSPRPRGRIRLAWDEGDTGQYGVELSEEQLNLALEGGDGTLVLRIEDYPRPQVRIYGTPNRDFTQSLLEDRGDVYPARRLGSPTE